MIGRDLALANYHCNFAAPSFWGFVVLMSCLPAQRRQNLVPDLLPSSTSTVYSIQVEAIPTKKARVGTPDFSLVKRPRSSNLKLSVELPLGRIVGTCTMPSVIQLQG